jgi:endo-1,4-beta-xylanase
MVSWMVLGLGCNAGSDVEKPAEAPAVTSVTSALTGTVVVQSDFEDGTTQSWFSFGNSQTNPLVANSTDFASKGTHSLLTTNRTSGFMGPGISLASQLTPGATYSISVDARLTAGETPPTTLKITAMRTPQGGSAVFESINTGTTVGADGWTTLTGTYSFQGAVSGLILYVESSSATDSYYIDNFSVTQTTPAPLSWDFEDGTTQGWGPFGSPSVTNSTDQAVSGTHSLLTSGRQASFNGPSINLQGKLSRGATYQVTLSARLVTGQPQSNLQATLQRTPTGSTSASFDNVVSLPNVTDQAWVTATALYTLPTDTTGLTFYVQAGTVNGVNASYYIDAVSITQVAPPPPAPPAPNTVVASSTFEDGTTQGWKSRTGHEILTVTGADQHGGSFSVLTTNRAHTYEGPAFDVTNTMFPLSRYFVSLWVKLAPGESATQLRVSLDRKGGSLEDFTTIIGNTNVDATAWVRLQGTFNQTFGGSPITLYVESNSGFPMSSFYLDDFSITYLPPVVAERNIPSVYQSVASVFPIVGAAVIPGDITGEPGVLLSKHFNSITSGNDMKWDATEKTEGVFSFTTADNEVTFAKNQSPPMNVRGHTLIWHNQTPAWVFNHTDGTPLVGTSADDQALLTQRIQNHITQVMTHFGDKVPVWDVINEAIDPSQGDCYRRSPWFSILDKNYIPIALKAARAASPNAKLYINDFDTTNPTKRQCLVNLVQSLQAQGVPIDGIGHQMHNNIEYPSPQSVIDTVNVFASLGIEQAVTEMDVSIYSGNFATPFTAYTDIPQSRHIQDAYSYLGFVQALKTVAKNIVSITIWGTSDDKSWLTSSTKVDAPLLFDPSLQHKYDYWAFVDPLQIPGADLSTTITAAPTTVPAGQAIAYTITVTNNADANDQAFDPSDDDLPAANVSLSTAVPPHAAFQGLTAPAGWSCATPTLGAPGPVQCTLASLPVGASATFTFTVTLSDCATPDAAAIVASANVTSSTGDPNPAPNNTASVSVQVANTPPVITANGALSATAECATPYLDPGASATDSCEGPVAVSTTSTVNTSQLGSYAVTYNAADEAGGQAAPVVRTVNVTDTTPPAVTVLGANPATIECATPFVDAGATAADTCAGPLPVTVTGSVNTGVPGSYSLGYASIDPSSNIGTATRAVTVADTTPPAVDAIDLTILAPGLTIIVNNGTLTIGNLKYPLNRSLQLSVAGHTITIQGGTITVDGLPALMGGRTIVLLPPNHNYRTFAIGDLLASVTDTCDTALGLKDAVITQISSDEPMNVPSSGNTQNDVVIASDCRSAQLRIERQGNSNGRVYDIALRAQDPAGNRTATTVQVMVPVTGLGAVDDGAAYTIVSNCN